MQEVDHIISLLIEAKKAAQEDDSLKLKDLSNQLVHSSSVFQDEDNIIVAVLLYALSKLIERKINYNEKEYTSYLKKYLDAIDKSIFSIKKNDFKSFRNNVKGMISETSKLSGDIRQGIEDIFQKARINKAARIYEHGISMEKTASLLGISMWELAEYSGQTNVSEADFSKTVDVHTRIKNAMEIFK